MKPFTLKFRSNTVSETEGVMYEVSLLQIGEAKGHDILVDESSLTSALEALRGSPKLPAFLTHSGALVSDRLLQQVGYFMDFFIDDGKLKASKFVALDSFKEGQPQEYRKLFDIALNIPETFGVSLVFEAELAWKVGDKEIVSNERPSESSEDKPYVRFVEIQSADFVDTPAANEEGLFQTYKNSKNMTDVQSPEVAEAEEEIVEEAIVEEANTEEVNATEDETATTDDMLSFLAELKSEINAINTRVEELFSIQEEHAMKLNAKASIREKVLASRKKPIAPQTEEPKETTSFADKFMNASVTECLSMMRNERDALQTQLKSL
jgi:hypothetical protein